MSLESLLPALDDGENPELGDFKRRFGWPLPLTVIVTVLAMFGHRLGWFDMARQSWIDLALTLPIVLRAGAPFTYSVVATVAPQVFPASFVSMGRVAVYFEAAAVIISLTLLGQILELKARSQTSAAIKSLLGLAPKTARRVAARPASTRAASTRSPRPSSPQPANADWRWTSPSSSIPNPASAFAAASAARLSRWATRRCWRNSASTCPRWPPRPRPCAARAPA
jgi:hypothetical protein